MSDHMCWFHNVAEDADGAHKVCGECGHVYMTKKDLMREHRNFWKTQPYAYTFTCPLCSHDF